jgi:hypothetical protein
MRARSLFTLHRTGAAQRCARGRLAAGARRLLLLLRLAHVARRRRRGDHLIAGGRPLAWAYAWPPGARASGYSSMMKWKAPIDMRSRT